MGNSGRNRKAVGGLPFRCTFSNAMLPTLIKSETVNLYRMQIKSVASGTLFSSSIDFTAQQKQLSPAYPRCLGCSFILDRNLCSKFTAIENVSESKSNIVRLTSSLTSKSLWLAVFLRLLPFVNSTVSSQGSWLTVVCCSSRYSAGVAVSGSPLLSVLVPPW